MDLEREAQMPLGNEENQLTAQRTAAVYAYQNAAEPEKEIELIDLFYFIFSKLRWIVLGAVLGALIAGVNAFFIQKPEYEATSKLYIDNTRNTLMDYLNLHEGKYSANDYREIFLSDQVFDTVIHNLGLSYTKQEMLDNKTLSVYSPNATRVLNIAVKSSDPAEASAMANEFAKVGIQYIEDTMGTREVHLLVSAVEPSEPKPRGRLSTMLTGLLLGAFLLVGFFGIQFLLNNHVRTPKDIFSSAGLPTLLVLTEKKKR